MTFTINWYTTTEKLEFLFRFEMDRTIFKQQFVGRHVAPLGPIILIPRQPGFALTLKAACLVEKYCYLKTILSGTSSSIKTKL
jgi:hypothetical protein